MSTLKSSDIVDVFAALVQYHQDREAAMEENSFKVGDSVEMDGELWVVVEIDPEKNECDPYNLCLQQAALGPVVWVSDESVNLVHRD